MLKQIFKKALPLLLGLACLGPFLFGPKTADASNPSTISFQGKVVNSDGTNVADGTYSFVFRIYDTSSPTPATSCTSDSACKWQETQSSVQVTNGTFQVELGSACALTSGSCNNSAGGPINFANNSSLYLTMQFNGDTSGSHGGFMWPVIHLTSVPFALQADNASTLGGLSNNNFVQLAQGLQSDSSSADASIAINKTAGTAGLLDLQRGGIDVATISNTGQVLFKPYTSSDSTTQFQVQRADSTDVFTVDTQNSEALFRGINSTAALGPDLITGITCSGTGWSGSGDGPYAHTPGSTNELICSVPSSVNNGETYQLTFSVASMTSGNLSDEIGDAFGPGIIGNVTNQTDVLGLTDDTESLTFWPNSTFDGNVTVVSVKKITPANSVVSVNNSDGSSGVQVRSGGSGLQNTFIGMSSGQANTAGENNTSLGFNALLVNTTGLINVAIGSQSLESNSSGSSNIAVGYASLINNTSGGINVAIGNSSLGQNVTGSDNTVLGNQAGSTNISGNNNTFLGYGAGSIDPFGSTFSTPSNLQGATAIGVGSQIQESNALVLGNQGINSVNVGIGTTSPSNTFSVSPDVYDTGTASVTSGSPNVTGSSTFWTSDFAGMEFIFADGTKYTIQSVTDSTDLVLSTNASATEFNSAYRIHNPAFYVSSTGQTQVRTSTNSTTGFQVQSASGVDVFTADTQNSEALFQGTNSAATFGPELTTGVTCSGTGWSGTGAGPYTHTTGFNIPLSCSPPASATTGATYKIIFDIGSMTDGNVQAGIGSAAGQTILANTTNELSIVTASNTNGLVFYPSSPFDGDVTVDSVKEVTLTNPVVVINNDLGSAGIEIRSGGDGNVSTFIGVNAGKSNYSGDLNVGVGYGALEFNVYGEENTAIGFDALQANTTGNNNNALGSFALTSNTDGSDNNAFGYDSLVGNTTGSYNNAIGNSSLLNNINGNENNAVGSGALYSNISGGENNAFGDNALQSSRGNSNSSVGSNSLGGLTTGNENSALGRLAGNNLVSGSYNSFIGTNSGNCDFVDNFCSSTSLQNATAIGAYSQIQESNALILGGQGANAVNVGIGTTSPTNTFSVSPDVYDAGTADVTSGSPNVTGTGTAWTSSYVGMEFIFADGTKYTIQSVTDGTDLVLSTNATATETSSAYRIHNPAFYVSSTGSSGIRTSTNSTAAFQVQNASGWDLFNIDTQNQTLRFSNSNGLSNDGYIEYDLTSNGAYTLANNTGQTSLIEQDGSGSGLWVLSFSDTSEAEKISADGNGGGLFLVNAGSGDAVTIQNQSSGKALDVQNAGGVSALQVTASSETILRGTNSTATLGSELATGVSCSGTNWVDNGDGTYTHTPGSTVTLSCSPPAAVTVGGSYVVEYATTGNSSPGIQSVYPTLGGTDGAVMLGDSFDEIAVITAVGTSNLVFTPSINFDGTVKPISVKQVSQSNAVLTVNNSDASSSIQVRSGGSGNNNTYIGLNSGKYDVFGFENTALGSLSLANNEEGFDNTALGMQALEANTYGFWNTAVGTWALQENTSGTLNVAIGSQSLHNNVTGSANVAIGINALNNSIFGNDNTAVGNSSGTRIGNGSNDTAIGDSAYANDGIFSSSLNLQNATTIGYNSQIQQSNSLVLGGQGANAVNVGIGTTSPTNLFSISPDIYDTGTASVTNGTAAVSGSGTSWTSSIAGMEFIFADGTKYTILSVTDGTDLVLSNNATATESGSAYRIHNPAFYVSSTGQTGIRTSTNSTSAFQVQDAAGNQLLNVDSSGDAFTFVTPGTTSTDGFSELSVSNFGGTFIGGNDAGASALNVQEYGQAEALSISSASTANYAESISTTGGGSGGGLIIHNFGGGTGNSLDVSDASNHSALRVRSTADVVLGNSFTTNGSLVFDNSAGSNTVGLSLQADPSSSYTLLLPTVGPSTGQCLQTDATTANQLKFAACSAGGGDNVSVNGSAATDANFVDVATTSSVAGITWSLNTGTTPNQISLNVSNADGTHAGAVTAGTQTIGGDKTFQGATTFAPTGNNAGTTIKQTSGTATSGSVFDVQAINGTSHFIQVTQTAANAGAVAIASLGSNDLTLDSGSGILKLGSNTTALQKAASSFTLDLTNAGTSTLTVSNSNGANVANLSVSGSITSGSDVVAGSGHVFKVGATSGSTISTCGANNFVSGFQSTGGLVTAGSCSTIASTQLSDTGNIAYLNAANTFAPTANNSGTTIRQTSGTATSGSIFDVQGANTTSHFIQVTETAANAGAVSIASIGSNDLTLDSGSGTLKLGSNTTTLQKAASALTLDVSNGASDSTLTIANSGGAGNIKLQLDAGGTFAVGATNGSTISACGANNYVSSFAATGGLVTGGSCSTIASSNLSDSSNIALLNAANTFAPTGNNVGNTFKQTSGTATSGNVFDIQTANGSSHFLTVANSAANEGAVTLQSIGATRALTLDSGSGTLIFGSNTTTLQKSGSALTLDLTNAGTSTLTVSNSNGANVANLSVSGDIAVGSGHVFKVGATSGSTIAACGANNYISSFASTGGLVTGGSCSTIASSNLSDSSNIALLNAANTFAPTGNNVGNTFKQTSGTATSGNVFDIQTANGTSHFIQITNAAANEGAVTVQSIGATRDLTLDSASGTIKLGGNSTSLQKSASSFTLDINNAGTSTLNISNTNGANVANLSVSGDIAAGSGHVFKVGATSGSTISTCGANNYVSSFASTGGLVTGGSCSTIASSNLSDNSNIALLNAANTFAPTGNNVGNTFKQTSGTATSGNIFDIQGQNGTSHFFQVTETAANAGAVNLSSLGSNDLTLDSGSGTLKFGANTTTLQKAASQLTLDVSNGASNSILLVSNSGGVGNVTLQLDSGGAFAIGATTGSTINTCGANNYVSSFASTGGLVSGGSCSTISSSNLSDGSNLAKLNSANTFQNSSDSSNAFQIKNQGGSSVLNVDNTKANANNLVANPSFESALSNWSAVNAGTPTQDVTQAYEQTHSLKIATGTNASGGGASYSTGATTFLSTNTTYTLSAYVKTDSSLLVSTFEMGDSESGTVIPCLTAQTLPQNGGWQRFTCTFTTSGTSPTNSFIYFKQTDTVNRNFYIDDVLLQTDANSDTNYRNAALNLAGTIINSPVVLQSAASSTTAFQVQNAGGIQVFNVDTTDTNLISNNDFEANSTGWSAVGTSTATRRDTSQSYTGISSLKIVTGTAADSGAQFTLNPVVTKASTTYTVSFYARRASGDATAFTDLIVRYSADGTITAGHFSDCSVTAMNSQTVANSGWTRYYCAVSSATTPTTSGYVLIKDTSSGTAHTFYVDAVQMEATTVANMTAYGVGTISTNAIINTPAVYKNISDSVTAFQIQNSGGSNLISADTLNSQVLFGDAGKLTGLVVFNNATNTNTISLTSQTGGNAPGSSITFSLPNALPGASNYCIVSSNLGILSFLPCGASATATVTLAAEYTGAVMTGDGINNTGTMTSDHCFNAAPCGSNQDMNYYSWTSTGTNDYDIWVRWQAPSDIKSYASGSFGTVSLAGWTTSASDSVTFTAYNSTHTSCGSGSVSTSSTTFTLASFTPNSSCDMSGGSYVIFDIHLSVINGDFARAGDIVINYNRQ